jgi:hypothetical protein
MIRRSVGVNVGANGESLLVRVGCSELGGLVGVGEVVMLDIMASWDDNGCQARETPSSSLGTGSAQ